MKYDLVSGQAQYYEISLDEVPDYLIKMLVEYKSEHVEIFLCD